MIFNNYVENNLSSMVMIYMPVALTLRQSDKFCRFCHLRLGEKVCLSCGNFMEIVPYDDGWPEYDEPVFDFF